VIGALCLRRLALKNPALKRDGVLGEDGLRDISCDFCFRKTINNYSFETSLINYDKDSYLTKQLQVRNQGKIRSEIRGEIRGKIEVTNLKPTIKIFRSFWNRMSNRRTQHTAKQRGSTFMLVYV